jgi:hypothetical protein
VKRKTKKNLNTKIKNQRRKKMKRNLSLLVIILVLVAGSVMAQTNTITVNVNYIANIAVSDDVDFTLADDGAGGYAVSSTDNTASLSYRHNGASNKRITGSAQITTPFTGASSVAGYDITATASGVTGGSSAGAATLILNGAVNGAQDLITGISRVGNGSATLTFNLNNATFANTYVTDADDVIVYTVTYTMTN